MRTTTPSTVPFLWRENQFPSFLLDILLESPSEFVLRTRLETAAFCDNCKTSDRTNWSEADDIVPHIKNSSLLCCTTQVALCISKPLCLPLPPSLRIWTDLLCLVSCRFWPILSSESSSLHGDETSLRKIDYFKSRIVMICLNNLFSIISEEKIPIFYHVTFEITNKFELV